MDVFHKNVPDQVFMKIEVTGTERMRGSDFWIRPDKLEYAENHADEDVWIILHYAEPNEQFVFVKPEANKKYQRQRREIRGAGEDYCIFAAGQPEVKSYEEFAAAVKSRLDELAGGT